MSPRPPGGFFINKKGPLNQPFLNPRREMMHINSTLLAVLLNPNESPTLTMWYNKADH